MKLSGQAAGKPVNQKIKDGKALELLVSAIENALAKSDSVKVEAPKTLKDKVTGQSREHDVVLTVKQQHHTVCIAIECKDLSRPVGVPQVEAFNSKCKDTGVDQGIIVSTSGFSSTARSKADHYGIKCLDIEQVGSFDWLLAPGFHLIERKLIKQNWTFFPQKEGVVDAENAEYLDEKGDALTMSVLTANAQRILNDNVPAESEPTEEKKLQVRVESKGLTLRNAKTGQATPVSFGVLEMVYSVSLHVAPFRRVQYIDKKEEAHITDAASAEFKFGDKTMNVVMVYKAGEGGKVLLTASKQKQS